MPQNRTLTYFDQIKSEIYNDILHISRASHYRFLAGAVEHLGSARLRHLRPSLRFDRPVLPKDLIGRTLFVKRAMQQLHKGESITLIGPGGVGKTLPEAGD